MPKVALFYEIGNGINPFDVGEGTIDELEDAFGLFKQDVADLGIRVQKFRSARDAVSRNPTQCDVYTACFGESDTTTLIARIENEDPETVRNSVRQYISLSEIPSVVGHGSDYTLAENVLAEYGKCLNRSFWSASIGAKVVDKKPA